MPKTPKERFHEELEKIFIGADVEGPSGYVKLMKLKSLYYKKIIKPYIDEEIREFPEAFREEAYSKLYTFFSRYFSDGGSIYFVHTRYHDKIYANVVGGDDRKDENYKRLSDSNQDIVLFWKTKGLYYIKTDRLYVSMDVSIEVDGKEVVFYFDASEFEGKKNNEKISLIYEFDGVDDKDSKKVVKLKVRKSERGKKTKIEEILKQVKKAGLKHVTDDHIRKAIRKFEMQSEVDFFIHKNAEKFLKEQFDLYLKTYLMEDETIFDQKRLTQLKKFKDIAYKIIDFIGDFEDELVKIWNKPRFVRNSHYVITLDRIWEKEGGKEIVKEIVDKLREEKKSFAKSIEKLGDLRRKKLREKYEIALQKDVLKNQLLDWYLLGVIDETFEPDDILKTDILQGEVLNEKWKHLPIDTKYFPDLEGKIVELFDNLDESLDGWIIKSENYQALNTILPKWREKIQTIYIDPPFNLGEKADFLYDVNYKDSIWLTLLENRIELAHDLLKDEGSMFVRCDYNGNMYVRLLMNEIFGEENFRNEIVVGRTKTAPYVGTAPERAGVKFKSLMVVYDNIYLYSKSDVFFNEFSKGIIEEKRKAYWKDFKTFFDRDYNRYELCGIIPEKGTSWMWRKEVAEEAVRNYQVYLEESKKTGKSLQEYWEETGRKLNFIKKDGSTLKYWIAPYKRVSHNNWTDIEGYGRSWNFKTENSESLLKRIILSTSKSSDIVLDFFLGSGTTTAVAHKLGRRWIGIEMGEHFYTVVLPRMKKVLFYDGSGISKDKDVKERYNKSNAGGFFKYYELEQYEEILRKLKYEKTEKMFVNGEVTTLDPDTLTEYTFMFDKKERTKVIADKENTYVDLQEIYKDVDVLETLSNITGRKIEWIRDGKFKLDGLEPLEINRVPMRYAERLVWW